MKVFAYVFGSVVVLLIVFWTFIHIRTDIWNKSVSAQDAAAAAKRDVADALNIQLRKKGEEVAALVKDGKIQEAQRIIKDELNPAIEAYNKAQEALTPPPPPPPQNIQPTPPAVTPVQEVQAPPPSQIAQAPVTTPNFPTVVVSSQLQNSTPAPVRETPHSLTQLDRIIAAGIESAPNRIQFIDPGVWMISLTTNEWLDTNLSFDPKQRLVITDVRVGLPIEILTRNGIITCLPTPRERCIINGGTGLQITTPEIIKLRLQNNNIASNMFFQMTFEPRLVIGNNLTGLSPEQLHQIEAGMK